MHKAIQKTIPTPMTPLQSATMTTTTTTTSSITTTKLTKPSACVPRFGG